MPEDHLARLFWAAVGRLDLTAFTADLKVVEGGPGRAAADPHLLIALWLYATSQGVTSARELDRLCVEHIDYIWICGGVTLNYHTLSDFRSQHGPALDGLMTGLLGQLHAAGLVDSTMSLRTVSGCAPAPGRPPIGGSGWVQSLAEARRVLAAVQAEDTSGESAARSARQRAARERAARERVERLERAGRASRPPGRPSKPRSRPRARVSTTDAEARVMKMADGGYRPAYNIQLAADTGGQVIVGVEATTSGSDRGLARPALEALAGRGYKPSDYLVDGGFAKNDDIEWAHGSGTTLWCPPGQTRHGSDPYAPKAGDSAAVADWRRRMASDHGKDIYRQQAQHQCINAHARRMGLRQLTIRGKEKARTALLWFALANNMLR